MAQPTVSNQLRAQERSLGERLFTQFGRKPALTDMGRAVYRYANEISSLARDPMDTITGWPAGKPVRFSVGIACTPFIIPTANTSLRRKTEHWFDSQDIRQSVLSEFEESAVLRVFDQALVGYSAAPTVIEKKVQRRYRVKAMGQMESVRERIYANSVEKMVKHPAALAIAKEARQMLSG